MNNKTIFNLLPKTEENFFSTGVSCIVFGSLIKVFGIFNPFVPIGFYTIGFICTIVHMIDKLTPNEWEKLFKTSKLYVKTKDKDVFPNLVKKQKTTYGYLLQFQALEGITSKDFTNKQMAIEEMLNHKVDISYHNKFIFIKVYEKPLQANYPFEKIKTKGELTLTLGYSYKGFETVDLSIGEPHCLIAGETGSGKSTLLRGLLTNIVLNYSSRDLELHLIDLKEGVELGIFQKCKIVKSFSRNKEEAEKTLYRLLNEVKRRYKLFYKNDCVDIAEYNKRFKRKKLNRKLIVIDEYSLLAREKNSIQTMKELAAIARACGIHLLPCTQRPSAKILDGDIKANIPLVIGLKTMNELNSRIIIDEGGLENLRGKGHGIISANGKKIEFQSMNILPSTARDLIQPYYRKEILKPKEAGKRNGKKKNSGEVDNFDFLQLFKGGKQ